MSVGRLRVSIFTSFIIHNGIQFILDTNLNPIAHQPFIPSGGEGEGVESGIIFDIFQLRK